MSVGTQDSQDSQNSQDTFEGNLPNLSQFTITAEFIALALKISGLTPSQEQAVFDLITTDSRKARAGALFVAIPGDKFDGHDFVESAVASGVSAVLIRANYTKPIPANVIAFRVEDTVAAYRKLGHAWRATFDIPIVCVAGSVGKTTTKELLAAALRGKWTDVLRTSGSQNGFVGIPMTLLELRSHHGAAVIEVGIDDQGAMTSHMPIVRPTHGIITVIGPEHLERLIDVPTVAREENISLRTIVQYGGIVALNLDDPWIAPLAKEFPADQFIGYRLVCGKESENPNSDPRTITGNFDQKSGRLTANGFGLDNASFSAPLPGEHNARNLLAAIAMARLLGLNAREINDGLSTFKGAYGRSQIETLPGTKIPVVCDYYNSNPDSMRAGLALLAQTATAHGASRRIACMGDMLELGTKEEDFHRGLKDAIAQNKIEGVLLYGKRMKWLLDELTRSGFKGTVRHFETHDELARFLKSMLKPSDAIMIKGSRSMKMEEVWKALSQ